MIIKRWNFAVKVKRCGQERGRELRSRNHVLPLHLSGASDQTCQDIFEYVVTWGFFKIVNFVVLAGRKKVARNTV